CVRHGLRRAASTAQPAEFVLDVGAVVVVVLAKLAGGAVSSTRLMLTAGSSSTGVDASTGVEPSAPLTMKSNPRTVWPAGVVPTTSTVHRPATASGMPRASSSHAVPEPVSSGIGWSIQKCAPTGADAGGLNRSITLLTPVSGDSISSLNPLRPTRRGPTDRLPLSPVSVSENSTVNAYGSPASGSAVGGVSASSQPLNASTTTPTVASAPNARRK